MFPTSDQYLLIVSRVRFRPVPKAFQPALASTGGRPDGHPDRVPPVPVRRTVIGDVTKQSLDLSLRRVSNFRTLERSLDTNKTDVYTRAILAAAYAEAGRKDDAARESAEVRRIDPRFDTADFGSLLKKPDLRAKLTSALAKAGL